MSRVPSMRARQTARKPTWPSRRRAAVRVPPARVVALLVLAGQPVTVVIDDALFRLRGKKVQAAGWFHDG